MEKVTITLSPFIIKELDRLAAHLGLTKSEMIRTACLEYIQKQKEIYQLK